MVTYDFQFADRMAASKRTVMLLGRSIARLRSGEPEMRTFRLFFMLAAGLALVSCGRDAHREGSAARQLGEDAHRASDEIKRDAEKARQNLRKAGKEVRQGWEEAKRRDDSRSKK
jgi:hypothetical protein